MTWETGLGVMFMLLGSTIFLWGIGRDAPPAARLTAKERELRVLAKSKRRLLRKHSSAAAAGYAGLAARRWDAARQVQSRIDDLEHPHATAPGFGVVAAGSNSQGYYLLPDRKALGNPRVRCGRGMCALGAGHSGSCTT